MAVFFDGERLCVQLNKNIDYKVVLDIAKEAEYSEYLSDVGIYCLPPTRRNAKILYNAGYPFDKSAMHFLKVQKSKRESAESEHRDIDDDIPSSLYPFQKEGVRTLLSNNKNYLIADEMGLGKTIQALTYLKMNPKALPAVVVCPASLKLNWANEVRKWVGVDSYILNGRTPEYLSDEFVSKYPIWIINYDILGSEDEDERKAELEREIYCKSNGLSYHKKKMRVYGWCDEIVRHDFKTIICDEVQNIAEPGTLRSRGVMQICEGNSRKIFLSGTPYETKTSQFFTCLHILDKRLFPNRWFYLMNYCDAKKTRFGWKFDGLSNAEELHEKVSTLMIRRLKKDVLSQLPPKTRIVVPMDVSKKDRTIYDEAERELDEAIENGEKNALSKLAALKQASFEAKKDCVIQWIKDYLEVNDKLVVFVYHKVAFDLLTNTFGKICVGINGGTPNALRQTYVDKFQKDKKVRLFIGQIKATNAGLTLTASNATCFVEFGTTAPMHEQAEDRVHRISQEADAVFAYYLILQDSIDESIMDVLNQRNANLKRVLNNEENEQLFDDDFNKAILSRYKKSKGKTYNESRRKK